VPSLDLFIFFAFVCAALDELLFGEMVMFTDGKLFDVSITENSKNILI